MKKQSTAFKLFFSLIFLFSLSVHAVTYVYIKQAKVYVKSAANSQARNIAALRQGTKVAYRKTQGNWYLISYKSSNGQVKSGWVAKGTLSKQRPSTAQPRYAAPPRRPSTAPRYSPPPRRTTPPPASRPSNYKRPSASANSDSKILVQAGLGGSYYTYNVSSDTQAFAYSFLGPSAQVNLEYNAWQSANADMRVKLLFDGNFAFYSSKTNLQDGSGSVFSKRTQNNMAFHVVPGLQVEKDLNPQSSAGLFLGYRYFSFMGDDIFDINNDPLGLYNSYTATGIVVGPSLSYKASPEITVNLAVNAVLMQNYAEDPEGTSGQVDAQAIGYMPKLDVMYNADFGSLSLRYSFHRIESAFIGNVSRVEQSFTNITAKTDTHFIGVMYNKRF
ncbi:MAG TPA: SH3 domain-containing protein [Oligoflexia bacterium]|nr:SH3 domain-containing protein [Oligoflexia bacterium]HMR23991.1 SH3 domain-containing protein [Oligoflexia bacterium]